MIFFVVFLSLKLFRNKISSFSSSPVVCLYFLLNRFLALFTFQPQFLTGPDCLWPTGEIYEERSWYGTGGDGGRVCGGSRCDTPQWHQGVWEETQRLVRQIPNQASGTV